LRHLVAHAASRLTAAAWWTGAGAGERRPDALGGAGSVHAVVRALAGARLPAAATAEPGTAAARAGRAGGLRGDLACKEQHISSSPIWWSGSGYSPILAGSRCGCAG